MMSQEVADLTATEGWLDVVKAVMLDRPHIADFADQDNRKGQTHGTHQGIPSRYRRNHRVQQ